MKSDRMPFAVRLSAAMLTGDPQLVDKTLCACMQEASNELLPVINGRYKSDLHFVAAAMIVSANCLRAVMDKEAQAVMDLLIRDSQAVAVDMSALLKQMGGGVMTHETTA